jgi:S-DNA-T family DNA segregation ATPase FtsK/SpoIIIE
LQFLPKSLAGILRRTLYAALGFFTIVSGFVIILSLAAYDITDASPVSVAAEFFMNSIGILASIMLAILCLRSGYVLLFRGDSWKEFQMPVMLGILSVLSSSFGVGLISGGGSGGILGAGLAYDLSSVPGIALLSIGAALLIFSLVLFVRLTGLKKYHAAIFFNLFRPRNRRVQIARPAAPIESNVKWRPQVVKKEDKAKPAQKPAKILPAKFSKRPGKDAYIYPPLSILKRGDDAKRSITMHMKQSALLLKEKLEEFGVDGEISGIKPGPIVTLYEFEPGHGVRTAKVVETVKDITRVMASENIRMAHIAGTNFIGVELPNVSRQDVRFQGLMDNPKFTDSKMGIPIALGVSIGGEPVYSDLAKMPHLMIAGRTGTGKSVFIQSIILSVLYKFRPDECKLILIDPKGVDFTLWDGIPHLLTPVVTDALKSVKTLKWAVAEMENRYNKLKKLGVQNLPGYNERIAELREEEISPTENVATGVDAETGKPIIEKRPMDLSYMPYLVLIIDEMADLMMTGGKEVEACLQRLAQKARAAGIHVVIATQRPSVETITGVIKANFPTRISFQTLSAVDSITILAAKGAEQLLPRGDMLYLDAGRAPVRIHASYISGDEAKAVADHLRKQGEPEYLDGVGEDDGDANVVLIPGIKPSKDDKDGELYAKAVEAVVKDKKPTVSYVQRVLRIGYNKAADFIERMEREGVITPPDANNKRHIR